MVNELIRDYIAEYDKKRAEHEALMKRASEYEEEAKRIIEMAKKKKDEAEQIREQVRNDQLNWIDAVVIPLATALGEATGLHHRVIGPCGICCRIDVILYADKERQYIFQPHKVIALQPDFREEGFSLRYETGKQTDRFAKGTVGELNGMNNETEVLPNSIDEILKLMRDVPALRQILGLEKDEERKRGS